MPAILPPSIEHAVEAPASPAAKRDRPAYVYLDAIRALAAIAVFLSHLRALFLVDFPGVRHMSIPIKAFYVLSMFGHQSVMVFFVLSGYFISASIFKSMKRRSWSWAWYAEQRLTRLYVVLIPALVLGAAWDTLGIHVFRMAPVYHGGAEYGTIIPHAIQSQMSLGCWLGNLFYLQTIVTPVFGSNGPLWSLSNEFWYYVLFPLCLFALSLSEKLTARVLYGISAIAILMLVGKSMAFYFLLWLLGVAVGCLKPAAFTKSKAAGFVIALVFLASMAVTRTHPRLGVFVSDSLDAITFSLFLYYVLHHPFSAPRPIVARIFQTLSGMSYSLYLVHLPVLVLISALLVGTGGRWQPHGFHVVELAIVGGGVLMYAGLVWRLAESKTEIVRRWLRKKLHATAVKPLEV